MSIGINEQLAQDSTSNNTLIEIADGADSGNKLTINSNGSLNTSDDGPVSPGTVATQSSLGAGQYNKTLPSPTNTQQTAIQQDYKARLIAAPQSLSYFHPVYTARVQSVTNFSSSNVSTLSVTLDTPTKANSLIVVYAAGNAHTITVTDSASQTYSTATTQTSGTNEVYIFYKADTTAGVTTVTITASTAQPMNMIVVEYSGISTTSPLDKTSTNSNAATSWTSDSTTATSQAIELLVGAATDITNVASTFLPGTNWTTINNVANTGGAHINCFLEEQFTTATGTYAATGTISSADTVLAAIATFKVATAPTGFTVPNTATVIKSSSGTLANVVINTLGTGSASATFYDNTTNSGTVIATISLTSSVGSIPYGLYFTNGLTMVVNSTTGDLTVIYD